jgi:hypothetical protein
MIDQSATDSGLAPGSATRRHHDPEAYCEQLEWLLVSGDAATGARGTMGGVVAQLEHGGPFTGVPETDIYSDQQIGWGKTLVGLVERRRWLMGAWFSLPVDSQGRLALCYTAPRAELRSDEVTHHHSGLAAQLGRYAALAFHLTEEPGTLLEACRQPTKGKNGRTIARALKAAREAAIVDHGLWAVAMGGATKPRKSRERRAILPAHVPHLPEADIE